MAEIEKGDDKMKEIRGKPSSYVTESAIELAKLNNNIR